MNRDNSIPVVDFDSINSFIDSELNVLQKKHTGFFSKIKKIFSEHVGSNFNDSKILASSEYASAEDLKNLSVHPALKVRKAVSENPNTPFSVLLSMYHAKNGMNSYLNPLDLVLHPNAPDDWIINVSNMIDRFHVISLLHRDNLPFEALEIITFKRKDAIFPDDDVTCAPRIAGKILKEKIEEFSMLDLSIFELESIASRSNSLVEKMCVALHENVGKETFAKIAEKMNVENPRFFDILKKSSRGDLRNLLNSGSFSYKEGEDPKSSYNELISTIEDENELKLDPFSVLASKIF